MTETDRPVRRLKERCAKKSADQTHQVGCGKWLCPYGVSAYCRETGGSTARLMRLLSNAAGQVYRSLVGAKIATCGRPQEPVGGKAGKVEYLVVVDAAEDDRIDLQVTVSGIGHGLDCRQRRGLGLSIAWGIVEKHGGTIDVTSSPGGGARLP